VTITSRHNPIVGRYRAAANGDAADVLLLDGAHLVADALAAGLPIREAAVTSADVPEIHALAARLAAAGVDVAEVTTAVMDALSPVRSSSDIVALADRPVLDVAAMHAAAPALVMIAVGVQDPGNLGAIVRVAEAGGATGFVAAGACADPYGWKALRGSMGSALRLPIAVNRDAGAAIAAARGAGCRIVAAVPRGGQSLFDVPFDGPVALVIGGEGRGLPPSIVETADEQATIPMAAAVESLNAAVTAALLVYEARRRRRRDSRN
jgi:RNA methyltransferase, TrmH family